MLSHHRLFWMEQPALLFALSLLIGTSSALFWPFPCKFLFPSFWILYLLSLRSYPPLLLLIGGFCYATLLYSAAAGGTTGYFSIASLQPHQSPFQKGLVYKGMLTIDRKRVPCSVHSPLDSPHKADCDYILRGKLKQRGPYDYLFSAKEWIPVPNTFSLAELRYQSKERLRHYLNAHLHRPRTASFLSSLLTGDVEERSLRYEFGKLGLQHILAISGFHFAILIAFCSFFFSLFLPRFWKIIALLLSINAYFLFVGSVPAVQRSWLMATLYLVSKLISRHSSGLNLLGVALLIEVLLDPLVAGQLGFQLSFLSCIGILLYRRLFIPFFNHLFPKVDPKGLPLFSAHAYLLSSFFKQGLIINFAVNAAILPLLLHHFHQFPLLALLYNLFFPLLVSLNLFILLLSLLFPLLFPFLDFFTAQLLDLSAYPPIALDYALRLPSFPAWPIPLYLFVLFCLSVAYKNHIEYYSVTMVR